VRALDHVSILRRGMDPTSHGSGATGGQGPFWA
jgi:hypothetical protein